MIIIKVRPIDIIKKITDKTYDTPFISYGYSGNSRILQNYLKTECILSYVYALSSSIIIIKSKRKVMCFDIRSGGWFVKVKRIDLYEALDIIKKAKLTKKYDKRLEKQAIVEKL